MKNVIEIKNLSKKYGEKAVLRDISFNIEPGKIVGLLGKNGAGKTTIIKLINGLLTHDSGEILFCGEIIDENSKKEISFLPERTYLDKTKTIAATLDFFADFYSNFSKKKAKKLLKEFNLDENARISALSKGMQEKVQLSLVMARKAKLYVLDEPLGGVDPASRDYILDTILGNFDDDASMLISTHLISDVERILDDVIIIDHGAIKITDTAENLRKKYHDSIDNIFRKEFKDAR